MPNLEDITAPEYIDIASGVEGASKKFSTEIDPDMKALLKTLTSKNITLSQWNAAITQLGLNVADVRRTYSVLKQVAEDLDKNLDATNTVTADLIAAVQESYKNLVDIRDYDFAVTSEADFDKCLYKLFVDEDTLTNSEAVNAFNSGSASLGVPDKNFKYEKVLVKDITFTKRRGLSDIRMHIFQPSIKYIRFENCRWEESWYVSGAVPTTLENAAPNLTLTVSGVHITEDNVNSLPSESDNNIWFKNIKRATDCTIDYPAGSSKADLVKLTFEYFSFADSCKATSLLNGTNVSNCIISGAIAGCKNCVNVMRDTSVLTTPIVLMCDGISNFSGEFSRIGNVNVAAYKGDIAVVKEDIAAVEGRMSSVESRVTGIEQYLGGDNFIVDDSIAYAKVVPKNACEKARIFTFGGMTYESENLIPNLYVEETTVKNGITFEKDGRGRVIVKGTATIGTYYTLLDYGIGQDKSLAKNAILTGCPSGGSNKTYRLWCSSSDGSSRGDSGKGCEMAAGLLFKDIYIYIGAGYTADNLVFEPKLRYFPILQDAKVTAIESVGRSLIPYPYKHTTKAENGITFIDNGDGSISIRGTATANAVFYLYDDFGHGCDFITAGEYYSRSAKGIETSDTVYFMVNGYRSSDAQGDSFEWFGGATTAQAPNDFIGAIIYIVVLSGTTIDTVVYPMLNKGSIALPYAPYNKHSLSIPAEVQAKDGYGLGINEKIYNYVDWKNKKLYVKCKKVVFDGSDDESWMIDSGCFKTVLPDVSTIVGDERAYFICDKYQEDSGNDLVSDSKIRDKHFYGRSSYFGYGAVAFKNSLVALDVTAWREHLAEEPITLVYSLAAPEIYDISDTLTANGIIDVEGFGTITPVNEHKHPVPSSIKYLVTYPKEV